MYTVPAVDAAIRVLRHLSTCRTGQLLSDIARTLGLNKSTCHNILKTLALHQVVYFDPKARTYELGVGLVSLVSVAAFRCDITRLAIPFMNELVRAFDMTCLLAKRFPDDEVVVVYREESHREIRLTADVGRRLPLISPALGRSILAWEPEAEIDRITERFGLPRRTPASITDAQDFRRTLLEIRQRRYATSLQEWTPNVNAVAAPILGPDGRATFTISLVGLSEEMSYDQVHALGREVSEVAQKISALLSGVEPADQRAQALEDRLPGVRSQM